MEILNTEDLLMSTDNIVSCAFEICKSAEFPVEYEDVYDHLYGSEKSALRFLVNDYGAITGFGVAQNYNFLVNEQAMTLAYLQGMVISKDYQSKGYSRLLLGELYKCFQSDYFGLRTQNPKMARALLKFGDDITLTMPKELIDSIRQLSPYDKVDDSGVVRGCYQNQLYPHLDELRKIKPDITLGQTDALAVVVQPKKIKQLVRYH